MILAGNPRGGAKILALHLLKPENEYVEVHELRGFASDNLISALNEAYAVRSGTKCRQTFSNKTSQARALAIEG